MNIKIKKHFLYYKGYKLKCAVGKSGITSSKKEGDLATPKGTFGLGMFYYRKDNNKPIRDDLEKRNTTTIKNNLVINLNIIYRIDINFNIKDIDLDAIIGRTAHILFLE